MADPNNPPPPLPAGYPANDPLVLWVQQQIGAQQQEIGALRSQNGAQQQEIGALRSQNGAQQQEIGALQSQNGVQQMVLDAHQQALNEIQSYFELRELATRVDRVIVKDLLQRCPELEFFPPGTPVAQMTLTGLQLYNILERDQDRAGWLPREMGLETLRVIGGVLSSLKMRADSFAHDRVFGNTKLRILMDQVFAYINGSGTGHFGRKLIQWILENYSDYLMSGSEQALKNGKQVPMHKIRRDAEQAAAEQAAAEQAAAEQAAAEQAAAEQAAA